MSNNLAIGLLTSCANDSIEYVLEYVIVYLASIKAFQVNQISI
jgi:hypothetical protein